MTYPFLVATTALVAFFESELTSSRPTSICAFAVPRTIDFEALKLPSIGAFAVITVIFSATASCQ